MIEVPEIPTLSRLDLYLSLGLVSVMEPTTEDLMRERIDRQFTDDDHDSPHSSPWHVSFHASQFPGDKSEACARKLVYQMMNVPAADGPVGPWVMSTAVLGKAGEIDIADAWYKGGRLLAIPEDTNRTDIHQLGFRDSEHWLTGSVDLPILPPGWHKPHIVEVKSKADEVLLEMINGRMMMRDGQNVLEPRGPDDAHVRQVSSSLGLAHEYDWGEVVVCKHSWRILWAEVIQRLDPSNNGLVLGTDAFNRCPEHGYDCQYAFKLERPTTGEIYYWSRSWPRGNPRLGSRVKSFFYQYDPDYMARGREVLKESRKHFIEGTLPARSSTFQWSVGACQYCKYKPVCRLDEGIEPRKRKPTMSKKTTLDESNAVVYAKTVRSNYDLDKIRKRVFAEWREENHD